MSDDVISRWLWFRLALRIIAIIINMVSLWNEIENWDVLFVCLCGCLEQEKELVQLKREARLKGGFYVSPEAKLLFVVRIRGWVTNLIPVLYGGICMLMLVLNSVDVETTVSMPCTLRPGRSCSFCVWGRWVHQNLLLQLHFCYLNLVCLFVGETEHLFFSDLQRCVPEGQQGYY